MGNALWITLIGMGLVFLAILLLWGLMVLLVRLTREPQKAQPAPLPGNEIPVTKETPTQAQLIERKRRAAAAAVAVAFATIFTVNKSKRSGMVNLPMPGKSAPSSISAWQVVHRASQISQHVNAPRKKVVR